MSGWTADMARVCHAVPVTMDAADHDRAVALVSHAPHVVASAMATRFAAAPAGLLELAGKGAYDVTRIAAGDPALWFGILSANAHAVADIIEEIARDLVRTAEGLRAEGGDGPVMEPLVRGAAGQARIPG
jgi:prephenate dehydrogenase